MGPNLWLAPGVFVDGAPPRYGLIEGNIIRRNDISERGGIGIYVDGGQDIVINGNLIIENHTAIYIAAEQPRC